MVMLTTFPPPTEGVKHIQHSTSAFINTRDLGSGTLYIAESRVSWVGNSGEGFSLEYPHITLHAVSKDRTAFPHECLYLMLDSQLEEPETKANGEDSEDDESESNMTEVRFVPEDRGVLDAMFEAMSFCQTLHPDPNDSFSDEGDFEDAEEEGEYGVGDGNTEDNEDEPMETGQFEDADPDH